jgi:hypothetical protein
MKKLMLAALVSLAILPGCGKKNDAAVSGVGVAAIGTATVGLQGSCFYMNVAYGSGATVTFSGNGGISPYTGALQAQLQGASVSLPGVTHTRTNSAGDTMQVYVPGSPGSYSTAYAVAYLHPITVAYLQARSMQVCGIQIDSPVASGTLTMSSRIYSQYGYSGISL